MAEKPFDGKVALITGAGHPMGIGYSTAMLLAKRGASVICTSLTETCEKAARDIVAAGYKAVALRADLTNSQDVKGMVAASLKRFGRIDILVNNAGGILDQKHDPRIEDINEEDWDRIIAFNLKSAYNTVRFIVPSMRKRRYGKIVNIGSGAGLVWSWSGIHSYAAAKAGLMGFTRQLAKELGSSGINVNCIAVGLIMTRPDSIETHPHSSEIIQWNPMKRLGNAIEVAYVIAFLASDEASYVTGQTIPVDGGIWMH